MRRADDYEDHEEDTCTKCEILGYSTQTIHMSPEQVRKLVIEFQKLELKEGLNRRQRELEEFARIENERYEKLLKEAEKEARKLMKKVTFNIYQNYFWKRKQYICKGHIERPRIKPRNNIRSNGNKGQI